MSFNYTSNSLEDIHQAIIETLAKGFDYESSPRGKPIRELIAASFTLTDPRNRLIMSPARAANYGFGVGELCWYIRGEHDLKTMAYYNKRMSQFSDNGVSINSAYGHRLFRARWFGESPSEDLSQLDNVIAELKSDPHSRRAVMHINDPQDMFMASRFGSKDVPCTMSLQLLIRDRKLHMHVLMRSNDIVWGLPYDVFSFTCLMECFLYKLQLEGVPVDDLGDYHHTAGSLHLYETHFEMAGEVSNEVLLDTAPMKPFTLDGIQEIAEIVEPAIRNRESNPVTNWLNNETETWMVDQLVTHRAKRDAEEKEKA